jgi:hypothetical protein
MRKVLGHSIGYFNLNDLEKELMKLSTVYCEGGAVYEGQVTPHKTKPERMVNQVELRLGRTQQT